MVGPVGAEVAYGIPDDDGFVRTGTWLCEPDSALRAALARFVLEDWGLGLKAEAGELAVRA